MFSKGTAITVENVSKCFEIYANPRDQLKSFLYPSFQKLIGLKTRKYFQEVWALRNINFQVPRGEAFGIVGLNGSGKSTLLQIIAGTLSCTSGRIAAHGRIAALLELGSGFNPNFTGRENVYMTGAVLGLKKSEIELEIESIESFADIGDHFDQAFTTYSSGMQMRVAFAVSTSFQPEILIIDEALAVGDAFFQQKCFQRIEEFKNHGGTLLFVSHDANSVKHLCDTAILLNQGVVVTQGDPKTVIDLYQGLIAQKTDLSDQPVTVSQRQPSLIPCNGDLDGSRATWTKSTTKTTNGQAALLDFVLLDRAGARINHIESEAFLTVQYRVSIKKDIERAAFGLIVRDKIGQSIFETSTYAMNMEEKRVQAGKEVVVRFSFAFNLKAGQYSFSVGVADKGFSRSEFEEHSLLMHDVEQIQVLEARDAIFYGGIFNMKPDVSVNVV
jgi:lipopolysaccharide transport system ATP-binding protein